MEKLYSDHGPFVKKVEFNFLFPGGGFNTVSKSQLEKKLFGESNAFVEFFHLPSNTGASGFRIVKSDSTASYVLEAKYISNYEELQKEASKKYPTINIRNPKGHPLKELCMQILTDAKANELDDSKYMTILAAFKELYIMGLADFNRHESANLFMKK